MRVDKMNRWEGQRDSRGDCVCAQTDNKWIMEHTGYGGQNVHMDIDNQLVYAYVTNSLKAGIDEHTRTYHRIVDAIYECLHPPHSVWLDMTAGHGLLDTTLLVLRTSESTYISK